MIMCYVHIALKLSSHMPPPPQVIRWFCKWAVAAVACTAVNAVGRAVAGVGQCFWPMALAGVFVGARRVFM
jgi:hypothetical protein